MNNLFLSHPEFTIRCFCCQFINHVSFLTDGPIPCLFLLLDDHLYILFCINMFALKYTPKTNINMSLEREIHLPTIDFQGIYWFSEEWFLCHLHRTIHFSKQHRHLRTSSSGDMLVSGVAKKMFFDAFFDLDLGVTTYNHIFSKKNLLWLPHMKNKQI